MPHLDLNAEQQQQWHNTLISYPARITQPHIQKIILGKDGTWIQLNIEDIEDSLIKDAPAPTSKPEAAELSDITISPKGRYVEIKLPQSYAERKRYKVTQNSKHNSALLTAISSGYRWEQMLLKNPELDQKQLAQQEGVDYRYLTRALHLMFLAPDIIKSILDGTQPRHLTLASFRTITLPICWQEQRRMLNFGIME